MEGEGTLGPCRLTVLNCSERVLCLTGRPVASSAPTAHMILVNGVIGPTPPIRTCQALSHASPVLARRHRRTCSVVSATLHPSYKTSSVHPTLESAGGSAYPLMTASVTTHCSASAHTSTTSVLSAILNRSNPIPNHCEVAVRSSSTSHRTHGLASVPWFTRCNGASTCTLADTIVKCSPSSTGNATGVTSDKDGSESEGMD